MSSRVTHKRKVGVGFPGPVARLLLRSVLPADRREEFEGDLIEEAETVVLPRFGRRGALCWLWWQVAASAPRMLARRWEKEIDMHPRRWIAPVILLVVWGFLGMKDLGNSPYGGFDWGNSVVTGVDEGGPADRAGLREGDRILSMGGIPTEDLGALWRQPRTEIGQRQALVVERTDQSTGVTTTERIEVTYSPEPGGAWILGIAGGLIGLVFLVSGLLVYLKAPSPPSFLFAVVGLGFGGSLLPGPYIGLYVLRIFIGTIVFVGFLTAFACLLHLLLVFPKPKRVIEKKKAGPLIYLPVVVFALIGIINFIAGPLEGGFFTIIPYALGIVLLGYAGLSIVALIHSYVKAEPHERGEEGLNLLLAGVAIGLLPITFMVVVGMFGVRTDRLPGADFYSLTLALIPISLAFALLKDAGASPGPIAAKSA